MSVPEKIISIIESKNFSLAASQLESLLEGNTKDENLWFAYGVCLKELNRFGEGVDAFLRSWVASKQTYDDAVSNALWLLPKANPDEGLEVDFTDQVSGLAAVFREEFENQNGIVRSDDE